VSTGQSDTADTASTSGAADTAETPTAGGEQEGGSGRRPVKRSTRIALLVIVVLAVVAAIGFAVSYFLESSRYVTTDNAQVDGTQIPISAPATGTLVRWTGTQGSVLRQDQVVGRIQLQGGYVQPQLVIRAPDDGTIARDDTTNGAYVTAGTQLAVAYDPGGVFVTARVDETDIDDVHEGAAVDLTVDAYPGAALTGTVRGIQGGAAGVFSPFPQSNSSGNFQKVTQVIPVKVAIDDPRGLDLIPGMNVTASIHER
jgi:multidrug resistance efflux pump